MLGCGCGKRPFELHANVTDALFVEDVTLARKIQRQVQPDGCFLGVQKEERRLVALALLLDDVLQESVCVLVISEFFEGGNTLDLDGPIGLELPDSGASSRQPGVIDKNVADVMRGFVLVLEHLFGTNVLLFHENGLLNCAAVFEYGVSVTSPATNGAEANVVGGHVARFG